MEVLSRPTAPRIQKLAAHCPVAEIRPQALRDVRAIARDELTPAEAQTVDELIAAVDTAMLR